MLDEGAMGGAGFAGPSSPDPAGTAMMPGFTTSGEGAGLGEDANLADLTVGAEPEGFDKDELANLLAGLADDSWVVERTLSDSPFETTQLVRRRGGSTDALFVRKAVARDAGLGAAYESLFSAQVNGTRFTHLPLIYDFTKSDDSVAIVTEYVQGLTLKEARQLNFAEETAPQREDSGSAQVRPSGAPDMDWFVARAFSICFGLCDAMTELHEFLQVPVIHRDIKPSNIVLSSGKVMLVDLGIARTWRPGAGRDTVRLGTPGYAPPEQYGYGQTTVQSDIYSAGMTMAYCFLGEDPTSALRESGFADSRIPPRLQQVLSVATAIDPARRFKSARAMKAALEGAAAAMRSSGGGGATANTGSARKPPMSQPQPSQPPQLPQPSQHSQYPRPPQPPQSPRQAKASGTSIVGYVWDCLLALCWFVMTGVCVSVSFTGGTEFLDRMPAAFRLFEYLMFFIVPSGLVTYLLMDRRFLRRRSPFFAKLSWKSEIPICIGIIIALYTVGVVAFFVLYAK